MTIIISEADIFCTAKLSSLHIYDQALLWRLAGNASSPYVSLTNNNSVTVNLRMAGPGRGTLRNTLAADGLSGDIMTGTLALFYRAMNANIDCIEFADHHPKAKYAEWFSQDRTLRFVPLDYDCQLVAFSELSDRRGSMARKIDPAASENNPARCYAVYNSGGMVCTSNIRPFSLDNMAGHAAGFDGYTGDDLNAVAVKINQSAETVDVAQILQMRPAS